MLEGVRGTLPAEIGVGSEGSRSGTDHILLLDVEDAE